MRNLVVSFLTLSFALSPLQAATAKDLPIPPGTNSKKALSILINDPVMHQTYDQMQARMLRTDTDLSLSEFLNSTPLLRSLNESIEAEMHHSFRQAVQHNQISMTPVTASDNNQVHKQIFRIFQQVLEESGRTQKEISEARLFLAMGDVNAYTFSGKGGPLVIVLQSGLLDLFHFNKIVLDEKSAGDEPANYETEFRLFKAFVKSVVAHEDGHWVSDHVTQGAKNMGLMVEILKYFGTASESEAQTEDSLKIMVNHILPDSFLTYAQATTSSGGQPVDRVQRDSFLAGVRLVSAVLDDEKSRNAAAVQDLINGYIDELIQVVLKNGEMDPEILRELLALKRAEAHMVSNEILVKLFKSISALVSREDETSADFFTYLSTRPKLSVGPHLAFAGDFIRTSPVQHKRYMSEIDSGIVSRLGQTAALYADATDEEIYSLLGSGNSHPFPGQRVENILRYSKTVDGITMRNPFLRLVALYDGLLELAESTQSMVTEIQKAVTELQALKGDNAVHAAKQLKRYQDLLAQEQTVLDNAANDATVVEKVVVQMVSDLGLAGPSLKSNLRFTNLVDLQLARKNQYLRAIESLEEVVKQSQDPALQEEAKLAMASYAQDLREGDDLLNAVGKAMQKALSKASPADQKSLNERLNLIAITTGEKITLETIAATRAGIAEATGTVGRESRIETDPRVTMRKTSIKEKYVKPEILAKRREELSSQAGNLSLQCRLYLSIH